MSWRRWMATDAEIEAFQRRVSRNMTRAITALVLAGCVAPRPDVGYGIACTPRGMVVTLDGKPHRFDAPVPSAPARVGVSLR